ncbi:MAG: hypothetical protein WCT04_22985 [Planctomycetota bacterium]
MRHLIATLILLALATTAIPTRVIHAGEGKKKQPPSADDKSYSGKVSVQKSGDGKLTAVKIIVDSVVYNVTLDDIGTQLGKQYEGITAEVQGTVTDKKGEKWITVTHLGAVPEKKKKKK